MTPNLRVLNEMLSERKIKGVAAVAIKTGKAAGAMRYETTELIPGLDSKVLGTRFPDAVRVIESLDNGILHRI